MQSRLSGCSGERVLLSRHSFLRFGELGTGWQPCIDGVLWVEFGTGRIVLTALSRRIYKTLEFNFLGREIADSTCSTAAVILFPGDVTPQARRT